MTARLVIGQDGEVFEINSTDHVDEVGLYGQLDDIRAALAAGRRPPAGSLLGLPELDGDVWVDIAGAAAVSGARPKTITGWLSRGGPKRCPFPAAHRFLYRLYWPLSQVEAWRAAYSGTARARPLPRSTQLTATVLKLQTGQALRRGRAKSGGGH